MNIACEDYEVGSAFDELIAPDGAPRPLARGLCDFIAGLGTEELLGRVA
ncbi:MAG: hypothetical protein FD130_2246, partial [Halothiobacillaceae bacterium]